MPGDSASDSEARRTALLVLVPGVAGVSKALGTGEAVMTEDGEAMDAGLRPSDEMRSEGIRTPELVGVRVALAVGVCNACCRAAIACGD